MRDKYVSFDIFDTLIRRVLSTNKIYEMMELVLVNHKISFGNGFCSKRLAAEESLSGKIYTLDDIYNTYFFQDITLENIEVLKSMEIEYEINNCVVNEEGKSLYDKYKDRYQVICISDMYFNFDVIEKILQHAGYIDIKKIYVSSDAKAEKKNGKLFQYVLQDLNIHPWQMIHFGDSWRRDWLMPKLNFIRSKHISRKHQLRVNERFYFEFGFWVVGPVIYEFCNWIHEKSKGRSCFFLSREGEVLARYYDILFGSKSKILYISRKVALRGLAYKYLNSNTLQNMIEHTSLDRYETIGSLLKRIGLDDDKVYDLFEQNGFQKAEPLSQEFFDCFETNKHLFMYLLHDFSDLYCDYLRKNLNDNNYLIDLGWQGSIQKCIELAIENSNQNIYGLYFGCVNSDNKAGFLFESKDHIYHNIMNFSGLLENIFMPMHGSVISLRKAGEEIEPVYDEFEFDENSCNIISEVQSGIEHLIMLLQPFAGKRCFDKCKIREHLIHFGCVPSVTYVKKFKGMGFYDNGEKRFLIEDFDYFNIKSCKRQFIQSKWKTAYLINGLKISYNYSNIINMFRKLLG
ncbi:MAG: hypothetical protein MRZ65_00800 [Lachnospiraceae bacterium]|nr:hypothetical protein [Lachnospiraceae bacterium]